MSQETNYRLLLDITLQPCNQKICGKRGVVREVLNGKHFTKLVFSPISYSKQGLSLIYISKHSPYKKLQ